MLQNKLERIKDASIIGVYGDTFRANFENIPQGIQDKLNAQELAQLVDAFYKCYNQGKNDKRED